MLTQFSRTELLLGKEAMDKLKNSRVAVFGIGGVGGYVCEALVRSGVGAFDLIDDDKVCLTNLNRQIIATRKTVGKYKVDVMKERMLEINPDVNVRIHKCFFLPENADEFPFDEYDYVVDAVDTVTAKIELVMKSQAMNVPIISSMGAGNKLDASAFKVADIYKTQMCPLAKVMRPRFYFYFAQRSFTTSPAIISPTTDGTNATLPGISLLSVHLCSAPGGQIQWFLQLIAMSSIGLVGFSSE